MGLLFFTLPSCENAKSEAVFKVQTLSLLLSFIYKIIF